METKDIVNLAISVMSALVALYAVFIARAAVNAQRHAQSWSTNYELLAKANEILAANPDLLQLHGIDPDEFSKHGVSALEVVYVNHHLDAGGALHKISGEKKVQLTEYRRQFLLNPKVRVIWKNFLRERLFKATPYSVAIDEFIAEIESNESGCSE